MRAGLWAIAKAVFWRRWSLVAVVVAALVYLLCELLIAPTLTSRNEGTILV
jgi:hypothetical protein